METDRHRIVQYDVSGAYLRTIGGNGSGDGQFSYPEKVTANAAGARITVADTRNQRLQFFDAVGSHLGTQIEVRDSDGLFNLPTGLTRDASGNIYVADTGNWRIQKFNATGVFLKAWGRAGSQNGEFAPVYGLAYNPADGLIYAADGNNRRIQKFTTEGQFVGAWPLRDGGFPYGLAFSPDGTTLYVTDLAYHRIGKYSTDGTWNPTDLGWGQYGTGNGDFSNPKAVAVDAAGDVYVADDTRVQKFDPAGTWLKTWLPDQPGYNAPRGLTVGGDGYVYLTAGDTVQRFDLEGNYLTRWGSSGDDVGEFNHPEGIVVDAAGEAVVVDSWNNRVQQFSALMPYGKRLVKIRDAAGGETVLGYGGHSKVESLTDPAGHTAIFEYDARQRLVASTDMAQVPSSFTYQDGAFDNLVSVTTPSGTTWVGYNEYGYDPAEVTTPVPTIYQIRQTSYADTEIEDPLGKVTTYQSAWTVTHYVTDSLGGRTEYIYDVHNNRTGIKDELGHTTTWTLDDKGRTTSSTDAEGRTTTWVYDDVNHTKTETGPAPFNYTTFSQYDAAENLLSVRNPAGKTTTMTYYPDGRLHTVTTPLNKTTTYVYDDLQRTTTITDPLNNTTILGYDELGNLVTRRDAEGNLTTYEYDGLGRRWREWHPDLTWKQWDYDCCGLSRETDERGRKIEYLYDALHHVTDVINKPDPNDPGKDSVLTTYHYDGGGRREWMKDTLQRQTGYEYDDLDRLTKTTYPDGTFETRTYYADGNLHTKTDRMQRTITYVYDNVHRLFLQTDPIGPTQTDANLYVYVTNNPVNRLDPSGRDTVGCDGVPDSLESSCRLECCAKHDECYAKYGCTACSWGDNPFNPFGWTCDYCNSEVITCILKCGNKSDNPNEPNYYCAKLKKYVRIPGDYPDYDTAKKACKN